MSKNYNIVSFRRTFYITDNKDLPIPLLLLIPYEDRIFRLFLSDDNFRCFICKSNGHKSSQCPQLLDSEDTIPVLMGDLSTFENQNSLSSASSLHVELNKQPKTIPTKKSIENITTPWEIVTRTAPMNLDRNLEGEKHKCSAHPYIQSDEVLTF